MLEKEVEGRKEDNKEVQYIKDGDFVFVRRNDGSLYGGQIIDSRGSHTVNENGGPICVEHNKLMKPANWVWGMDRALGFVCPGDEKTKIPCDGYLIYSIT